MRNVRTEATKALSPPRIHSPTRMRRCSRMRAGATGSKVDGYDFAWRTPSMTLNPGGRLLAELYTLTLSAGWRMPADGVGDTVSIAATDQYIITTVAFTTVPSPTLVRRFSPAYTHTNTETDVHMSSRDRMPARLACHQVGACRKQRSQGPRRTTPAHKNKGAGAQPWRTEGTRQHTCN